MKIACILASSAAFGFAQNDFAPQDHFHHPLTEEEAEIVAPFPSDEIEIIDNSIQTITDSENLTNSWSLIHYLKKFGTLIFENYEKEEKIFADFIVKYGRNYANKEEYEMRFKVFKNNLAKIQAHNHEEHGNKVGLNVFADWTDDEYGKISGKHHKKEKMKRVTAGDNGHGEIQILDTSVSKQRLNHDWRRTSAVTSAIRQLSCGSCWAFTTAAALESANKIRGNTLKRLAPQQLVDCASNDAWGNFGCDGGFPNYAFSYAQINAVVQEKEYPYNMRQNPQCKVKGQITKGVKVDQYWEVKSKDPEQLKAAIFLYGPVAVVLNADDDVFRWHKTGVIKSAACGTKTGHAVLAVGYGRDSTGEEYVVIKNSWGDDWGENGFGKVSISQRYSVQGVCGILSDNHYATAKEV